MNLIVKIGLNLCRSIGALRLKDPYLVLLQLFKSLKPFLFADNVIIAKTHERDSNRLLGCLEPQEANKGN